MDPRPTLRCIVGKRIGDDYVAKVGDPLTLAQAECFAAAGWEVILDPDDLSALARWEQLNRSSKSKPKWNRW
jgi:hypothetical protein